MKKIQNEGKRENGSKEKMKKGSDNRSKQSGKQGIRGIKKRKRGGK